jgi:hypothetical protein
MKPATGKPASGGKSRLAKRSIKGVAREPVRPGGMCPRCHGARLAYDGCLNLGCPRCGFIQVGAFT